jgi:UDPglucose 6-dehydrogenase
VPPDTCSSLQQEFPNVDIVFNPEFLTEANAETDFIDQDRIVIGHGPDNEAALTVVQLYNSLFSCPIYLTDWTTAEMVKYTANCFLATKVSFANEIKQITDSLELNYDEVIRLATLDKRLGNSHWQVPGPMVASDGSGRYLPGFSGSCFIKDINALINVAKSSGVSPTVLQAAWHKNVEVRPERDWEALVGRAISNNEESK